MSRENLLDGKKILAVDDEPDVLDTLEELLPMCSLSKAASFEEAIKALESDSFDLLILDIMGVHGYKILDCANRKKITTVMLTAHALSPEHIVKSYKKGAASYIPKDEINNITDFLCDVLEAKQNNKNTWSRWLDRFSSYCQTHFGVDWQNKNKDFWEKFISYDT
jgi:DNA-binding NtrC family response regulator